MATNKQIKVEVKAISSGFEEIKKASQAINDLQNTSKKPLTDGTKSLKAGMASLELETRKAWRTLGAVPDSEVRNRINVINNALDQVRKKAGVTADEIRRAEASASKQIAKISGNSVSASGIDATKTSVTGLSGAMLGAVAVAGTLYATLSKYITLADSFSQLTAKLRLVTNSQEQLLFVQEQLFKSSQNTRTSITETASLYATLTRATERMNTTDAQRLKVTDTINKALVVSGASATSAQAALIQLGQGLGAGALRGEELNSVLEQAPRLAKAIADGMGVSISELKGLGEAGKLTSEAVFTAIEASAKKINDEFGKMPLTFDGAMTQMGNSLTVFAGAIEKTTGVASGLSTFISGLAKLIEDLAKTIEYADSAFGDVNDSAKTTGETFSLVGAILEGLRSALEVIVIIASDVAFTFKAVGRELGAWAAQIAAIMRGDFTAFSDIAKMATEDAELARKELDDYQAKILSRGRNKAPEDINSRAQARIQRQGSNNTPNKPDPPAGGAGGKAKQRIEVEKADLEAQYKAVAQAVKDGNDLVNRAYEQGYIGIEQTFMKRQALIKQESDAEILQLEAEKKRYEEAIKKSKDPKEKAGFKKSILDIEAKLRVNQSSAEKATRDLQDWKQKQRADLENIRVGLKLDLASFTGFFDIDAVKRSIEAKFEGQKIKIQAEITDAKAIGADTTQLEADNARIETLKSATLYQAEFNAKMAEANQLTSQQKQLEENLNEQVRVGQISELEANNQIKASREATIVQLNGIKVSLQEINALVPDGLKLLKSDQNSQIQQLGTSVLGLKETFNSLGQQIKVSLTDNLTNAFISIADGSKTAGQAFKDMLKSMLLELAKSQITKAVSNIFSGFTGFFGGGVPASGPIGKADGGYISGPGTETSDSIPARLSNGEFVMPAKAVKLMGVDFFEAIRQKSLGFKNGGLIDMARLQNGIRRASNRFANGGLVTANSTPAISVQMVNNGTPQQVVDQKFDMRNMILQVVTEDLKRGGPINAGVENTMRRRR